MTAAGRLYDARAFHAMRANMRHLMDSPRRAWVRRETASSNEKASCPPSDHRDRKARRDNKDSRDKPDRKDNPARKAHKSRRVRKVRKVPPDPRAQPALR
jgi:hypothetical protein